MYLWNVLHASESELINKVYSVQTLKTTRGGWSEVIHTTKEILSIEKTDEEIKGMKKETFRNYVEKKVSIGAFQYLQTLAKKHSKSEYTWNQGKLEKQKYLEDKRFSRQDIQLLFALKSRMISVKTNFRNLHNNNMECQTCDEKSIIEDENHILNCENLKTEESVQIDFKLVYGCLEEQLKAVKIFKKSAKKKRNYP